MGFAPFGEAIRWLFTQLASCRFHETKDVDYDGICPRKDLLLAFSMCYRRPIWG